MAKTTELRAQNSYWSARRELADTIRDLQLLLLTRELPETKLREIRSLLAQQNTQAENHPPLAGKKAWGESRRYGEEDPIACEVSPLIGKSSALSPPLRIWLDENLTARAEVIFDWRFEGPYNCAHGGYIAAVFDEFLGWAQLLSGGAGATRNLSVDYHKPTPLNTQLKLSARLVKQEGRKLTVHGEMFAGEVMTASCEGFFISFGEEGTKRLHESLDQ